MFMRVVAGLHPLLLMGILLFREDFHLFLLAFSAFSIPPSSRSSLSVLRGKVLLLLFILLRVSHVVGVVFWVWLGYAAAKMLLLVY